MCWESYRLIYYSLDDELIWCRMLYTCDLNFFFSLSPSFTHTFCSLACLLETHSILRNNNNGNRNPKGMVHYYSMVVRKAGMDRSNKLMSLWMRRMICVRACMCESNAHNEGTRRRPLYSPKNLCDEGRRWKAPFFLHYYWPGIFALINHYYTGQIWNVSEGKKVMRVAIRGKVRCFCREKMRIHSLLLPPAMYWVLYVSMLC